ncbi:unnamed protein product [Closterium sp. Yama58-4]|nr:unnamed protein product [Closterium sp. Yama58-4]
MAVDSQAIRLAFLLEPSHSVSSSDGFDYLGTRRFLLKTKAQDATLQRHHWQHVSGVGYADFRAFLRAQRDTWRQEREASREEERRAAPAAPYADVAPSEATAGRKAQGKVDMGEVSMGEEVDTGKAGSEEVVGGLGTVQMDGMTVADVRGEEAGSEEDGSEERLTKSATAAVAAALGKSEPAPATQPVTTAHAAAASSKAAAPTSDGAEEHRESGIQEEVAIRVSAASGAGAGVSSGMDAERGDEGGGSEGAALSSVAAAEEEEAEGAGAKKRDGGAGAAPSAASSSAVSAEAAAVDQDNKSRKSSTAVAASDNKQQQDGKQQDNQHKDRKQDESKQPPSPPSLPAGFTSSICSVPPEASRNVLPPPPPRTGPAKTAAASGEAEGKKGARRGSDGAGSEGVNKVQFARHHPDLLAYGATDGTLRLCYVPCSRGGSKAGGAGGKRGGMGVARVKHELKGHTKEVTDFDWSTDDDYLCSSSADKSVRVWDVGSGQCLRIIYTLIPQTCIIFHPQNNNFLVVANSKKELTVMNFSTGRVVSRVAMDSNVTALVADRTTSATPAGSASTSDGGGGVGGVGGVRGGATSKAGSAAAAAAAAAGVGSGGFGGGAGEADRVVFVGDSEGAIHSFTVDKQSGALQRRHKTVAGVVHPAPVASLHFSPTSVLANGPVLLACSKDGCVRFYTTALELNGYLFLKISLQLSSRATNMNAAFCPPLGPSGSGEYIGESGGHPIVFSYSVFLGVGEYIGESRMLSVHPLPSLQHIPPVVDLPAAHRVVLFTQFPLLRSHSTLPILPPLSLLSCHCPHAALPMHAVTGNADHNVHFYDFMKPPLLVMLTTGFIFPLSPSRCPRAAPVPLSPCRSSCACSDGQCGPSRVLLRLHEAAQSARGPRAGEFDGDF